MAETRERPEASFGLRLVLVGVVLVALAEDLYQPRVNGWLDPAVLFLRLSFLQSLDTYWRPPAWSLPSLRHRHRHHR
jgi:hypothetical protein